MSMNDIKAMLLHILHRLEQMVIGFQMGLPGDAIFNQRSGEEGDLPGRCFRIAWRQEGNLMPLRDLFFNKMMKNILRPTVIPGRNRDPGGRDLCYPHIPFLYLSAHHRKSACAVRYFFQDVEKFANIHHSTTIKFSNDLVTAS